MFLRISDRTIDLRAGWERTTATVSSANASSHIANTRECAHSVSDRRRNRSPYNPNAIDRLTPCCLDRKAIPEWYRLADTIDQLNRSQGGMARPKHSIRYDDDLWPLLESLSESTGRPITTIVNDALRAYLIPAEDGMEARMSSIESTSCSFGAGAKQNSQRAAIVAH